MATLMMGTITAITTTVTTMVMPTTGTPTTAPATPTMTSMGLALTELLQSARMATILIIRMLAHPTAITPPTTLWAVYSLEQAPGTTDITDAAFMGAATTADAGTTEDEVLTGDAALTVDAATTAGAATPVEVLSEPTADVLTVGARGTAEPTQEIAIVAEDTWRAVAATQVVPAAAASAGVAAQASTAVAATVAEVPTEEAATATEVPTAAAMADTGNPRSLVRAKRSDLRVRPFSLIERLI
jgi:hypothetical protein